MSIPFRRLLCVCATLFVCLQASAQAGYTKIVVFGDSLSDTGNVAHLVNSATGGTITFPADNPALGLDYTLGRFTDGKDTQPAAQAYFGVWIEQLAASFAAAPAVKDSLDGGTNYAYGDATTAAGTKVVTEGPISITLHNMGQQVNDYLGTSPAPVPDAQTLYVLWGGAKDIYEAINSSPGGTDINAVATAAANTAVTNEVSYIQQLVKAGATQFMLPNLPPLGGAPTASADAHEMAENLGAAVFQTALNQAIATLKTTFTAQGVTVTFYQPDIFDLYAAVAGNPMTLGLGNVTSPAQNISGSPDTYLSWDGLHPTTTGHHYVAQLAANLLTPLTASKVVLTAPSTAVAGQTVTLSAAVTSAGSATAAPTGLVTFFQGSTAVGSAPVSSGAASATVTVPAAAGTAYSYTAVYVGDTTYNYSQSAAVMLSSLAASVTTTTGLTATLNATGSAQTATLAATVTPAVTTDGTPTGTVTFLDGTTTLGTATLSNGVASFTTPTLSVSAHSFTAVYAGAGIFGGSTSAAVAATVAAPSFTAAASPTSLTVSSGGSGTTTVSATSAGGYTGTVALSCGTLPAHFSCSFSTTSLSVSATAAATATLTLATGPTTAALYRAERPGTWAAPRIFSALLLPGGLLSLLLVGTRRRRHAGLWLGSLLLLSGMALGLSGCGGSSNKAAAGTYSVPVVFTPSSGTAQTVNVSVTVQ